MCCDSWHVWADVVAGERYGHCPDCETSVVIYPDGSMEATHGCNYSPTSRDTCGAAFCDGSC